MISATTISTIADNTLIVVAWIPKLKLEDKVMPKEEEMGSYDSCSRLHSGARGAGLQVVQRQYAVLVPSPLVVMIGLVGHGVDLSR